MEPVQESTDGDAPRPFTAGPIPGFSPFSLLPDELIVAIATRLRASMVTDGVREPQPTSSLDYLANVDKRIRRIALAIRWEVRSSLRSGRVAPGGTLNAVLLPLPRSSVSQCTWTIRWPP